MHKLLKIALFLGLIIPANFGYSQSFMFGAGATYGSDIQQIAPNFRIYYGVNERFCFGPEYSYFPSKNKEGYDVQLNEYGLVAHYIFEIKEKVGVFPLIGLNYSVEKEKMNEERNTTEAFGASFGLGFHMSFNNFLPYAEYKYITGELSQSTVSIGLIYNLRIGKKKHSDL